jgi:hypothetical protein
MPYAALKRLSAVLPAILDFAGWAISESIDENDVIGHPSLGHFSLEMGSGRGPAAGQNQP